MQGHVASFCSSPSHWGGGGGIINEKAVFHSIRNIKSYPHSHRATPHVRYTKGCEIVFVSGCYKHMLGDCLIIEICALPGKTYSSQSISYLALVPLTLLICALQSADYIRQCLSA